MSFKASGLKTRPERVKPPPSPDPVSPIPSRRSSIESRSSFASAVEAQDDESAKTLPLRFSAEEESRLLEESHKIKAEANLQFTKKDYTSALSTYDKAIAECPNYLDYELAVLQSNIAACHLQLKEWREAIESAEIGLECLERELPMPKPAKHSESNSSSHDTKDESNGNADDKVIEIPDGNNEEETAEMLRRLDLSDQKKSDIHRIRTKLLLRRARARVMLSEEVPPALNTVSVNADDSTANTTKKTASGRAPGSKWGSLSGALEDYSTLAQPEYFRALPTSDQKTVLDALKTLPAKVEAAKKKEVDEMMGKLKDLGNGILKPFGLSTDMFKMTQDPNTGGWSMNFDGKAGK